MTIKEFLEDKTLDAVDTVENIIINLVIRESNYGIDVDTSNITSGTLLTRRNDFVLTETTLSVDNIQVNIETTNML